MWPWILTAVLAAWIAMGFWQRLKPLAKGLGVAWPERSADEVRFLADESWFGARGERHLEQTIFDEMLALIGQARRLVVLDAFLFNDFSAGTDTAGLRPLCADLTAALLAQKRRYPGLQAVVITDPFNTLYGGLAPNHFEGLRRAGVTVVFTDLNRLRASNPLWSGLWHLGPCWLGNSVRGGWLPNALGPGRVTLRSYLAMLNFKANHRKTLVVDRGDGWAGLVTSANPHDASSLHGNVALRFAGDAALDLLASERTVAAWSGIGLSDPPPRSAPPGGEGTRLQLLTERAIRDALLAAIEASGEGDRLDLAVFYLAHRRVIGALKQARRRGAEVRALLDLNRDAFGLEKSGIPNRPVARELVEAGIAVRWCATRGEQCHSKLLLRWPAQGGEAELIVGSANFTRRNLDNLNLETSVRLLGRAEAPALEQAAAFFERRWSSSPERTTSEPFAAHDDATRLQRLRYRIMEASGLSTF